MNKSLVFNNVRSPEIKYLLVFFVYFTIFIVFLGSDTTYAQQFPDCMRCHKDKAAGNYVHPVSCVSCHTQAHRTGMKEKFPRYLFAQGVDLCWGCHDKKKFLGKIGHPPVAKGECLSCHDVHTSDYKALIPSPMPKFCFKCHENSDFVKKVKHPPVVEGRCTGCHDAHGSEFKKLLLTEMPKECYLCHNKEKYISEAKKKHHSPVSTGMCLSCHEPHSSNAPNLLLAATPDLCFTCHDSSDFTNKYNHSPVAAGMCASCHEPHQGDAKKLLLSNYPELCFICHTKGEFDRKNQHPPVSAGMCSVCHEPHASPAVALLDYSITDGCLMCHPRIGNAPHAASGFSQAGHPLKDRKDPSSKYGELSCTSCHDPHSSEYINLFRFSAKTAFELCSACHKYGKKSKK